MSVTAPVVPSALDAKPPSNPEREAYYQRMDQVHTAPLWEVLAALIPTAPRPRIVPHHWSYQALRPLLMESGHLITAREAERRVMILENPGIRGESLVTNSLYAGIQLVLPGEHTASHRHTMSALRFVLESPGGYTAVNGEKTTMRAGDFIVTPSWTWHDHGNDVDGPITWMDVLDVPIVNLLDASFAEHHPQDTQAFDKNEGDALARYGTGLLPVDYKPTSLTTPQFVYPYSRTREALETLLKNGPVHDSHGVKMQFVNPGTGGSPMPTIGTFIQLLPKGFKGQSYRQTDATVYCAAEGEGVSHVGEQTFHWKKNDVFVAPSWFPVSHESANGGVLFSASDRPVQKALGLWREQVPAK
jgi:gentisate 1,2-dioxygenase